MKTVKLSELPYGGCCQVLHSGIYMKVLPIYCNPPSSGMLYVVKMDEKDKDLVQLPECTNVLPIARYIIE